MGRWSGILREGFSRLAIAGVMTTIALGALAPAGKAYIYWTNNAPGFSGGGTTMGRADNDGHGVKAAWVSDASSPGGIVVHGKYIYWDNIGTDSVGRVATNGSGANPKFISSKESVLAIANDNSHLYWAGSGDWISMANLDGSHVVADCINAGAGVDSITVSGGFMYIGEFQVIDRVQPSCGATPSTFVTLSTTEASATSMALGGGYLYWAELNLSGTPPASSIGRAPLSDPASLDESFIPGLYAPSGVALGGGYLYWVDHEGGPGGNGAIGREQIGPASPNYNFIDDAKGPAGIAVDGLSDPTSTSVTCSPTRVAKSSPTVCTAVVHDSASSELPTGTVLFHGSASIFFPGGNTCTLGKRPSGGASCTVGAESAATGKHVVTGTYKGNPTHHASSGSATFCAGSKNVCKRP